MAFCAVFHVGLSSALGVLWALLGHTPLVLAFQGMEGLGGMTLGGGTFSGAQMGVAGPRISQLGKKGGNGEIGVEWGKVGERGGGDGGNGGGMGK